MSQYLSKHFQVFNNEATTSRKIKSMFQLFKNKTATFINLKKEWQAHTLNLIQFLVKNRKNPQFYAKQNENIKKGQLV